MKNLMCIYCGLGDTSCGALVGMMNSSMGPPWGVNPTTHHNLSRCTTMEGRKEMFYLTTHSTHFIYGYMASAIWLRTILIARKETHCCHIGYSFRLTARVLLYTPSNRQDSTYHGICYTSRTTMELISHLNSKKIYKNAQAGK